MGEPIELPPQQYSYYAKMAADSLGIPMDALNYEVVFHYRRMFHILLRQYERL